MEAPLAWMEMMRPRKQEAGKKRPEGEAEVETEARRGLRQADPGSGPGTRSKL